MSEYRESDHPRKVQGAPGAGRWTDRDRPDGEANLEAPAPDLWTPYEHARDVFKDGPWDMRIRGERDMEDAITAVGEANHRLERAGIEERFTLERSRPLKLIEHGRPTTSWMVRLNRPVISYKGWRFAAELERDASGAILSHNATISRIPDTLECEHCHTRIDRTKTYMLVHEDGTQIQVGSTCVETYLGIRPKGLWTLDVSLIDEYAVDEPIDDVEEDGGYDASLPVVSREDEVPARAVLAAALDISDGGKNWIRREDTPDGVGTSDIIKQEIRDDGWRSEGTQDPRINDVIKAVQDMSDDTEYARNLKALAGARVISFKNAGLLASAVTVYARAQRATRTPSPATPGFIAPEGQPVPSTEAKVTAVRAFEDFNPYTGRPMTTRMVLMRDSNGHTIKWNTTGRNVPGEGDRIRLTGGTVKRHGEYRGEDQSIVTRLKFEPIPA